jgi:hypothetical protein
MSGQARTQRSQLEIARLRAGELRTADGRKLDGLRPRLPNAWRVRLSPCAEEATHLALPNPTRLDSTRLNSTQLESGQVRSGQVCGATAALEQSSPRIKQRTPRRWRCGDGADRVAKKTARFRSEAHLPAWALLTWCVRVRFSRFWPSVPATTRPAGCRQPGQALVASHLVVGRPEEAQRNQPARARVGRGPLPLARPGP